MSELDDLHESMELAQRWKLQIDLREKDTEYWEEKCGRIISRYRDAMRGNVTGSSNSESNSRAKRRFNVFWSNVQTLLPCVYGREPQPIAERRFLDKDVSGRVASQILERALRYEMADSGYHDTMQQCVLDYLLVGRGVPWLRFEPLFGPDSSITDYGDDQLQERDGSPVGEESRPNGIGSSDQNMGQGGEADTKRASDTNLRAERSDQTPEERLLDCDVKVDYVNWRDFLHSKARVWEEVEWVARKCYLTRKDCVQRWGDKVGNAIPLQSDPEDEKRNISGARVTTGESAHTDNLRKATVYEIWNKPKREIIYYAKGYDRILEDPKEDTLNLEGFFPCPRPLYATMTNDTLEPVPDFDEYHDQADELDRLTRRIDLLLSALRVAGVYDSSQKQLARLLDEVAENKLYPVSSWAAFAEKGGLQGAVSYMPIEEIAKVLQILLESRDKIKQDLYEITGMGDIIRGQADPRETATAVATKGRFGTMRLQARQKEVQRFCRDVICMMGEIIAEHFPDEVLLRISGIEYDDGIGPEMPKEPKPPTKQQIIASMQQRPQMPPQGGPPQQQLPPPQPQLSLPGPPQGQEQPPIPGARKSPKDGEWYVDDKMRPGKYMRVRRAA